MIGRGVKPLVASVGNPEHRVEFNRENIVSELPPQPFGSPTPIETPPVGDPSTLRSKLQIPAILMIITGVVGILCAGYSVLNGFVSMNSDIESLLEIQNQFNPNFEEGLEQMGTTPEAYFAGVTTFSFVFGGFLVVTSLLCILAGFRMRLARSYGLSIIGAICCVLPCLQPCCVIGLPAGIWSFIVLMNADVKRLFN